MPVSDETQLRRIISCAPCPCACARTTRSRRPAATANRRSPRSLRRLATHVRAPHSSPSIARRSASSCSAISSAMRCSCGSPNRPFSLIVGRPRLPRHRPPSIRPAGLGIRVPELRQPREVALGTARLFRFLSRRRRPAALSPPNRFTFGMTIAAIRSASRPTNVAFPFLNRKLIASEPSSARASDVSARWRRRT